MRAWMHTYSREPFLGYNVLVGFLAIVIFLHSTIVLACRTPRSCQVVSSFFFYMRSTACMQLFGEMSEGLSGISCFANRAQALPLEV